MEKVSFERSAKVKQKLDYWSNLLRDISGRNRLLYWKDTKSSSAVITEPDLLSIFDRIVVKDKALSVPLPDENELPSLFDHLDDPLETIKITEARPVGPNECASDKNF